MIYRPALAGVRCRREEASGVKMRKGKSEGDGRAKRDEECKSLSGGFTTAN